MRYSFLKKFLIVATLCVEGFACISQTSIPADGYPRVGQPSPEFKLRNIEYYHANEVTLADFKGKWLILDFWNKYCVGCISSFPKINQLAKTFKNRVEIMMVGREDPENQIRSMYAKFREKMGLQMPCAFDSQIVKRWGWFANPTIMIIDPKGIVRGISYKIDSADLASFLSGGSPRLPLIEYDRDLVKFDFDPNVPLLSNSNGGEENSELYRSIISKATAQSPYALNPMSVFLNKEMFGKFYQINETLTNLYMLGYFGITRLTDLDDEEYGKVWHEPIIEASDTATLNLHYEDDKPFYCYYFTFPPEKTSKGFIMSQIQMDLKRWFGYQTAIVHRKMPCWRLVATKNARKNLLTKGGKTNPEDFTPHDRLNAKNWTVQNLLTRISHHNIKKRPFIDDTGIKGNIDILMDCIFSDFEDVKRELRRNGLDLVEGQKLMKVLVIRDPKPALNEDSMENP